MLELVGKRLKENRDVRTGWQEVERKPKCQNWLERGWKKTKCQNWLVTGWKKTEISELVGKRLKENRSVRTGWQEVGKNKKERKEENKKHEKNKTNKKHIIFRRPTVWRHWRKIQQKHILIFLYIFFNYLLIDALCKFIYRGCISVLCLFIIYLALIWLTKATESSKPLTYLLCLLTCTFILYITSKTSRYCVLFLFSPKCN